MLSAPAFNSDTMTVVTTSNRQSLDRTTRPIHDLNSQLSPSLPHGKLSMSVPTTSSTANLGGGASSGDGGAGAPAPKLPGGEPGQVAPSAAESHRTVAQRTLAQHLSHYGDGAASLDAALADIHPGLVSQCAPVPSYRILAAFDDIATHVLLDSLFLGFRTRKMDLGVTSKRPAAAFRESAEHAQEGAGQQHQQQSGATLAAAGSGRATIGEHATHQHHQGHHAQPQFDPIAPSESMFVVPESVVRTPKDHPVDINVLADAIRRYVGDEITLNAATHIIVSSIPWLRNWIETEFPLPYIRHFCRHFQRYISMHSAMAGFDLVETTRYDSGVISTPAAMADRSRGVAQAALVANRAWSPGDELLLCGGRLVSLSHEEEEDLQDRGRDFSVLLSRRSGEHNLFLGPGRFVNHDCRPNLAFVVHRTGEVHFRVLRPIAIGQELSVCYGGDYFGKTNCECMCESCELTHRGWFALTSGQQLAVLGHQNHNNFNPDDGPGSVHNLDEGRDDPMDVDSVTSSTNRHSTPLGAASSDSRPQSSSTAPTVGSRIVHRITSANSLVNSNLSSSAPALDWLDSPFFDGDDADRNILTAAISALSDFQRRVYIAMIGQDVHALGEPLTVPCALCQCRTYVYRISPQGHVHCHKCLRNVLLFAVPWPHRIQSAVANAATSAMVAQAVGSTSYLQQLPVHQQYAFAPNAPPAAALGHAQGGLVGSAGSAAAGAGAAASLNSSGSSGPAGASHKSGTSKKRAAQPASASSAMYQQPANLRPPELPADYIVDEVERRLLRQVTTPTSFAITLSAAAASSLTPPELPLPLADLGLDPLMPSTELSAEPRTDAPQQWASPTRSPVTHSASSSLSPAGSDLSHSRSARLDKVVATPEQMAEWRQVQAKLDDMYKISPRMSKVKWQFNDEGPLLVRNYNQRNLVLCLDKGIWYPAVTVPVSDWDDQKLDGNTPESFHVLFLNTSGRSYGCVHRLDMVLVTDILRGGRSLIFNNPEPAQQPAVLDQASSSTGGTNGKQPLIVRAGRDIEVTLKSVQAAAVERMLSPPPRAVWQKWHAEYKLISTLPAAAPFTYHPVANIDIRPMAASCRPNLVNGRAPRVLAGSKSASTRGSPDPELDSEQHSSGGKLLSSGRRTSAAQSRHGSPVVKGGRARGKKVSKDVLIESLKPTSTSPAVGAARAASPLSTTVAVLDDYVMATPKSRSPIVLHHAPASPFRAPPSLHGAPTSTSPSVISASAAVEAQKRMQPSPDSNEMSAMVLDHAASWEPVADADVTQPLAHVGQPLDSRLPFNEPLEPSTTAQPQMQPLADEPTRDMSPALPPLDQKMFGELSQMRCSVDFDCETAEHEAFSMYMTSVEWMAATGLPHLPMPPAASPESLGPADTSRPAPPRPATTTRHKAKRSAKDSNNPSSSRKAKKPKLA